MHAAEPHNQHAKFETHQRVQQPRHHAFARGEAGEGLAWLPHFLTLTPGLFDTGSTTC